MYMYFLLGKSRDHSYNIIVYSQSVMGTLAVGQILYHYQLINHTL